MTGNLEGKVDKPHKLATICIYFTYLVISWRSLLLQPIAMDPQCGALRDLVTDLGQAQPSIHGRDERTPSAQLLDHTVLAVDAFANALGERFGIPPLGDGVVAFISVVALPPLLLVAPHLDVEVIFRRV